jgi:VanZ family protein
VISQHRLLNFLHNHRVEVVAALCLLYVVLGTLIPFDFRWPAGRGRVFEGLGQGRSGLPDLLSNIALYLPLGVLFHVVLTRSVGHPWIAVLAATTAAAAVSVSCELLQVFSLTRVSSVTDFGANVGGAFFGALLACLCGGLVSTWGRNFSSRLRNQPRLAVVQAYTTLLVIVGLSPFTPTVDVTRLVNAARQSTLVPFGQDSELQYAMLAASTADNDFQVAAIDRDRMMLWASRTAELLSFVILGCLVGELLRGYYLFGRPASVMLSLYLSLGLAIVLSCLQFFIVSRGFHVTDILIRAFGALLGAVASIRSERSTEVAGGASRVDPQRFARMGSLLVAGFILFTALAPCAFNFEAEQVRSKLSSPALQPFYSYAVGRFDVTSSDLCSKAIRFGLFGSLVWLGWRKSRDYALGRGALVVGGWAAGISVLTEVAQLAVVTRVPSLTDPIVALVAAWVGAVLAQYACDFVRFAHRSRRVVQSASAPAIMTLTDQLIASLIPDEMPAPSPQKKASRV